MSNGRVSISGLPEATTVGNNDVIPSTQADDITRKISLGQIVSLVGPGGADEFLELLDTPFSYGGFADNKLVVNGAETGLIFEPDTSFENGLTEDVSGVVRLGGSLTQDTVVGSSSSAFTLDLGADVLTVEAGQNLVLRSTTADVNLTAVAGDVNIIAASSIDIDGLTNVTIDASVGMVITAGTLDLELASTSGKVIVAAGQTVDITGATGIAETATTGDLALTTLVGNVKINASNITGGVDIDAGGFIDLATAGPINLLSTTQDIELTSTAGTIKLLPTSAPSIGDVWTATNPDGSGEWQLPSVPGAIITADNGLTEDPSTNVQLGGPLIKNTKVGAVAGGFTLEFNASDINVFPDNDLDLTAGNDTIVDAGNQTTIRGNNRLKIDTGIGANSGMPTEPGDTLKAIGTDGEAVWQQQLQFAQWFLPFDAITDAEFPLVGEISNVAAAQVADFATTTAMRRTHTNIVVNSITTGGDIVITGDSVNPTTSVVSTGDTETITVDTTAGQAYQTDKEWLQIDSVDVTSGTIVAINYDINRLSYIFSSGEQATAATAIRVIGYRCQFQTNNNLADLGVQIFAINDDGAKKMSTATLEDIVWTSTNGNGVITDNLRTAGADRSYTATVTAIPSGGVYQFRQSDFNSFFTSDENLIESGANNGLQVIFTGTGAGLTNIEHGTFTLLFIEEPE